MSQIVCQPPKVQTTRIVMRAPVPAPVLQSISAPVTPVIPNKMIRLTNGVNMVNSGVRPMTKITFPIPAEYKMGKVFAKNYRKT